MEAGDAALNSGGDDRVPSYLFGDLLALARANWVRRMASGVADLGYGDYRRTDAVLVRLLRRRGASAIGEIGTRLGISRQAARKLVDGLAQRGYATEGRDHDDARVVRVSLTSAGEAYADAVIAVVHALNRELAERVSAEEIAVADAVLRATFSDEGRAAVDRMISPL